MHNDTAPIDVIQDYSRIAETTNAEISITIYLKGTIITGKLIGHTRFFQLLKDAFGRFETTTEEEREFVEAVVAAMETKSRQREEEDKNLPEPAYELVLSRARFIHLKDAEIVNLNGPNIPVGVSGIIRIREASIDAFALGELSGDQQTS